MQVTTKMHPQFETHVDQAVESLRARLLADVMATAERGLRHPGIRREWRQLVRRLAELRGAMGPAPNHSVQTPARNPES